MKKLAATIQELYSPYAAQLPLWAHDRQAKPTKDEVNYVITLLKRRVAAHEDVLAVAQEVLEGLEMKPNTFTVTVKDWHVIGVTPATRNGQRSVTHPKALYYLVNYLYSMISVREFLTNRHVIKPEGETEFTFTVCVDTDKPQNSASTYTIIED